MFNICRTFRFKVFTGFLTVILCCIFMVGVTAGNISRKTLEQNNFATASGLLNQVGYFCDSKFHEMTEILDGVTDSTPYLRLMKKDSYGEKTAEYYMDISYILNRMQLIKNNNKDMIDSIYYYNENYDLELYTLAERVVTRIGPQEFLEIAKDTGSLQSDWISVHDDVIFKSRFPHKVITLYRYTAGTLFCINLKTDIFQKALDYSVFGQDCFLILYGNFENMASNSMKDMYFPEAELFLEENSGSSFRRTVNGQGEKLCVTNILLDSNSWNLAAVMPETYLQMEAAKIYRTVFLWSLVILCIASVMAYFISRSVTEPVRFITNQLQKVQGNNLEIDFSLKDRKSELGVMAETLNQMERRMADLIQQTKEQEQMHKRLEIAVLQAQINPHFLYNALASAQGLVREHNDDRAEYLLKMLIIFLRTGLGRGEDRVTLKEELRHIESYMEIQKMREAECFDYEIEMEEEYGEAEILKLSLQPLIENAVYHGVREKKGKNMILISAVQEKGTLKICVFDDGAGMSEERLERVRKEMARSFRDGGSSVTYGLRNVHQRLILQYGPEHGISLESVEGEYTMVTMSIPYIRKRGKDETVDCR